MAHPQRRWRPRAPYTIPHTVHLYNSAVLPRTPIIHSNTRHQLYWNLLKQFTRLFVRATIHTPQIPLPALIHATLYAPLRFRFLHAVLTEHSLSPRKQMNFHVITRNQTQLSPTYARGLLRRQTRAIQQLHLLCRYSYIVLFNARAVRVQTILPTMHQRTVNYTGFILRIPWT